MYSTLATEIGHAEFVSAGDDTELVVSIDNLPGFGQVADTLHEVERLHFSWDTTGSGNYSWTDFEVDYENTIRLEDSQSPGQHIFIELDDNDNDVLVTNILPADVDPNDYQNYNEIEVHGLGGNDIIDARGNTRVNIQGGEGNDIIHAVRLLIITTRIKRRFMDL